MAWTNVNDTKRTCREGHDPSVDRRELGDTVFTKEIQSPVTKRSHLPARRGKRWRERDSPESHPVPVLEGLEEIKQGIQGEPRRDATRRNRAGRIEAACFRACTAGNGPRGRRIQTSPMGALAQTEREATAAARTVDKEDRVWLRKS